jgi:hypothetical protein
VGVIEGVKVFIKMTPEKNISQSSDYMIKVNTFEITMEDVPGAHSWEIAHRGTIRKQWEIKAADTSLKEKIIQAGAVSLLKEFGNNPTVRYDPDKRTLWYLENVQPRRVPSSKRFQAQLALLTRIAEINQQANTRI